MLIENQHPLNKSIMVSILGVPNAGKSTLVNSFMGTDLSVVTSKPQTTRNKYHCVTTVDRTEIVFVDTPGLHKSNKEFNKRLNQQAKEGIEGVDLTLVLIDLTKPLGEQLEMVKEMIGEDLDESWLVFNKIDLFKNKAELPLSMFFEKAQEVIPQLSKHFIISGKEGENIHELIGAICDEAKEGYHLYSDGSISNKNERFFATEYIREQAFSLLKDEIPYEVAVVIDEFKDNLKDSQNVKKDGPISHISASILVNRPSQRAIVIGTKGSMIKEIGTRARMKIEKMVGGQVHLNLHVKVSPNWQKNNFILEEIGLPRAINSNRVWHQK